MSFGGSKETKQAPNIPPALQELLNSRTKLAGDQVAPLGNLVSGTFAGTPQGQLPYTGAVVQPYRAAGAQASDRLTRIASPGTTPFLQTRAAGQSTATAGQAEAQLIPRILQGFFSLLNAQKYPTGTTDKSTYSPGLIDYLTTIANVGSAISSQVKSSGGGGGG